MKALLLECSCKILLANELILNVIVCVRPVEGLPVANRVPGVIFSLSIFIFLVDVLNDTRPWAGSRLFFLPKPARPLAGPTAIHRPLLQLAFEINDAETKLAPRMPSLYERK